MVQANSSTAQAIRRTHEDSWLCLDSDVVQADLCPPNVIERERSELPDLELVEGELRFTH